MTRRVCIVEADPLAEPGAEKILQDFSNFSCKVVGPAVTISVKPVT